MTKQFFCDGDQMEYTNGEWVYKRGMKSVMELAMRYWSQVDALRGERRKAVRSAMLLFDRMDQEKNRAWLVKTMDNHRTTVARETRVQVTWAINRARENNPRSVY